MGDQPTVLSVWVDEHPDSSAIAHPVTMGAQSADNLTRRITGTLLKQSQKIISTPPAQPLMSSGDVGASADSLDLIEGEVEAEVEAEVE